MHRATVERTLFSVWALGFWTAASVALAGALLLQRAPHNRGCAAVAVVFLSVTVGAVAVAVAAWTGSRPIGVVVAWAGLLAWVGYSGWRAARSVLPGLGDPAGVERRVAAARAELADPRLTTNILGAAQVVAFAGHIDEAREALLRHQAVLTDLEQAHRAMLYTWIDLQRGELRGARAALDGTTEIAATPDVRAHLDVLGAALLVFEGKPRVGEGLLLAQKMRGPFVLACRAHAAAALGDEEAALAHLDALVKEHGADRLRAALVPEGPASELARMLGGAGYRDRR